MKDYPNEWDYCNTLLIGFTEKEWQSFMIKHNYFIGKNKTLLEDKDIAFLERKDNKIQIVNILRLLGTLKMKQKLNF